MTPEEWKQHFGNGPRVDKDDHATAAMCLVGTPFGFTREMVSVLNTMIEIADVHVPTDMTKIAEDAIDRIEALLPPEDA